MSNLIIDPNSLTPEQLEILKQAGAIKGATAKTIPDFKNIGKDLDPIKPGALNRVRDILSRNQSYVLPSTQPKEDAILKTLSEILEQRKAELASGIGTQADVDLAQKAYDLAIKERIGTAKKVSKEKKVRKKVVDTRLQCRKCGKKRYGSLSTIYMDISGGVHLQYLNVKAVMSSLLNDEDFLTSEYYIANCHTCHENTYFKTGRFKNYRKLVIADEEISSKISDQLEKLLTRKPEEEPKIIVP